ncbi:MAG TPA: hypothetical protein VHG72_21880 [Polyangia bacterium]|nr:hypothetical protein [Polyangia bacterium]
MTDAEFEREALAAMRGAGATECEIVREFEETITDGVLVRVRKLPVIGVRCSWRGKQLEMTHVRTSPDLDAVAMRLTLDGIRRSLR